MIRPAVLALALLAGAEPAAGQTELFVWRGQVNRDLFGTSVAAVGDVDSDGHTDVAVSATDYDWRLGYVYVYSGRTGTTLYRWKGNVIGRVDGAGDVNGDGVPDVIYGAFASGYFAGSVTVRSGTDGCILHKIQGTNALSYCIGVNVSGAGDLDADGYDDFLGADAGESKVHVYSGRDGSELRVLSRPNYPFGVGLEGGLDVNADGTPDIVVGSPVFSNSTPGSVDVYSGLDGSLIHRIVEPGFKGSFGISVSTAGDVDADGHDDFIIGSPRAFSSAGRAYVHSGADASLLFELSEGGTGVSRFGQSVSGGHDVDGDGVPDFLVGAPDRNGPGAFAGHAYLFSGADASLLQVLRGPKASARLGSSVALTPDVDGGGVPDLLLGATFEFSPQPKRGYASLHAGEFQPVVYCASKLNSSGCTPAMSSMGVASTTKSKLQIVATDVLNQKAGFLFWGLAPKASPFAGGQRCVQAPLLRSPVFSGGGPPPDDCSGVLSFDWTAGYATSAGLLAGQTVFAQYWYVDDADATGVGLTDALQFVIAP